MANLLWFRCPCCGQYTNGKKLDFGSYALVTRQQFGGRKKGGEGIAESPEKYPDGEVQEFWPDYYATMIEAIKVLAERFNMACFARRPPGTPKPPRKPKSAKKRKKSLFPEG